MGLFKSNTDPTPGGGKSAGGPDPLAKLADPRVRGGSADAPAAREIDVTKVMMSGLPATGTIETVRRLSGEEDVQQRFAFEISVTPDAGEAFTTRADQAVAEDYLALVVAGQAVRLKCDPDDQTLVWIDWAGSADG